MNVARLAVVFLLSLTVEGCALLSKGDVPVRRYFSPDLPPAIPAVVIAHTNSELRLGRVTAGANISERIMFRESEHEVGFYDDRLWTEKPELYLKRWLTRVLFEEQGLRSVMRGVGPTLDIELLSFEEVKAPVHLARVKVAFSLSDERIASLQQSLTFERPIAESTQQAEGSAVANAIGEALRDAVNEVSSRVVADLARTSPRAEACPGAAGPAGAGEISPTRGESAR